MNHPQRQEWVPYLFGEASADVRQRLTEHLQQCPECAAEIGGWRRSLRKLDRWPLPAEPARATRVPLLKWGIAAALVLGIGFGAGRWSAPATADPKTVRAEIETSVKSSLASDLQTALATTSHQITNGFQSQINVALAGVADAIALDTRRQLNGLMREIGNHREEERQSLLALFDRFQKQHDAEFLSLRGDLETVASLADEEIARARQSLNQLAANKPPSKP